MMNEIDRVFSKYPFFGNRQITGCLRTEGTLVGHNCVGRLRAKMGMEAIYKLPKPASRVRSTRFIHIYF